MLRLVIVLVAVLGGVILVGMTIAPSQPTVRDWYVTTACPMLDTISQDICAAVRRASADRAV